jgi:lysozyme family protein
MAGTIFLPGGIMGAQPARTAISGVAKRRTNPNLYGFASMIPQASPPGFPAEPLRASRIDGAFLRGRCEEHALLLERVRLRLSRAQNEDLEDFHESWLRNRSRYERVAFAARVPAPLVAAIHWRERAGHFGTSFLHGHPFDRREAYEALWSDIDPWEADAVRALGGDGAAIRDALHLEAETTDNAALATYAEAYHGFASRSRGVASPYVYAGTTACEPRAVDEPLGVVALLDAIQGAVPRAPAPVRPTDSWHFLGSPRSR